MHTKAKRRFQTGLSWHRLGIPRTSSLVRKEWLEPVSQAQIYGGATED